ncbi:putative procollagen-lysine [Tupanvirus soda lake]|uniref:Procollagen-lysine n=2 Tax=Tupanvirus TaxID=2094720 RepID=A0AC62ADX1_9VIRU|nr:putative procollagen-lysine [Tupanvirus soda lake]QKU35876.1 putative procollagen-lysine [Tupanvirus soda lake]
MDQTDLLILGVGVSQHKNDGVLRFEHFCKMFELSYKILGDGKIWKGGDMSAGVGGGQKINEVLEAIKNMDNKLIILCDTFDLIPLAGKNEIIDKFNKLCGQENILFSSEVYCWPDENLANKYPVINTKYKYLNSGSIIGYRDNIYNLIKNGSVKDNDDDQLYFTLKYLAGEKIILDHKCELFQALNGSRNDIVIHKNRVYNKYTNSYPVFVHGNGPSKLFLNHIENYLETVPLQNYSFTIDNVHKLENQPKVFYALYIDSSNNEQFEKFINSVAGLNYQNKIVYVYDKVNDDKTKLLMNLTDYTYKPNTSTYIFDDFKNFDCDYYFMLEQRCIITKKDILHELIPYSNNYQRIISPMLNCKTNTLYTNFWGALDNNGFYRRSDNYIELVERQKRGVWNVPYVSGVVLISRDIVMNWDIMKDNKHRDDVDMQFCFNLRKLTLFMYMVNYNYYGIINES